MTKVLLGGAYTRWGLYSGGFIHGRKIALLIWGAYIRGSLYKRGGGGRGAYLRNFTVHAFKSNRMFGTKHLKINQLQKTIEYQTNKQRTKYSN